MCESLPGCERDRGGQAEGGRALARSGLDSVLLQDQVLQLVRRAEQEGRGLPVPGD